MVPRDGKRVIPSAVWALLAIGILFAVILLAISDRGPEPGPSLQYDVSAYGTIDPAKLSYRPVGRYPVDLATPSALAMSHDGRVFVAGGHAVVVLGTDGKEQARYTVKGVPDCMGESADGRLFLGMHDHIEVLDKTGTLASVWPDLSGRPWLTSIAIDDRNVYAADAGNRCIWRFDLDGKPLNAIGSSNPRDPASGFIIPNPHFEVLIDPSGGLWAVNPGKHGFENYRPTGELISSWYKPGMQLDELCGCCNPIQAAFCTNGSFVTVEKGLNRVKVYTPEAKLAGVVATPEMLGVPAGEAGTGQFDTPIKDVAVDSQNRIWLLHGPWRAVLVYAEEKQDS